MSVPENIRKELKDRLWQEADSIGWVHVSRTVKTQWYDNWAKDPKIGGVIERYVDRRQVRIYLKDTFLKKYSAARKADPDRPLRILAIQTETELVEVYEKPHGRRLVDGRIVVWGQANEWKALLMALHERAFDCSKCEPYGVVFFGATGRFADPMIREMIEDAGTKLGIQRMVWVEM
jgi:hypothetical protein